MFPFANASPFRHTSIVHCLCSFTYSFNNIDWASTICQMLCWGHGEGKSRAQIGQISQNLHLSTDHLFFDLQPQDRSANMPLMANFPWSLGLNFLQHCLNLMDHKMNLTAPTLLLMPLHPHCFCQPTESFPPLPLSHTQLFLFCFALT